MQGQELGSFLYGGSTVITLFRRGAIKYDADLQHNSRERMRPSSGWAPLWELLSELLQGPAICSKLTRACSAD